MMGRRSESHRVAQYVEQRRTVEAGKGLGQHLRKGAAVMWLLRVRIGQIMSEQLTDNAALAIICAAMIWLGI